MRHNSRYTIIPHKNQRFYLWLLRFIQAFKLFWELYRSQRRELRTLYPSIPRQKIPLKFGHYETALTAPLE